MRAFIFIKPFTERVEGYHYDEPDAVDHTEVEAIAFELGVGRDPISKVGHVSGMVTLEHGGDYGKRVQYINMDEIIEKGDAAVDGKLRGEVIERPFGKGEKE